MFAGISRHRRSRNDHYINKFHEAHQDLCTVVYLYIYSNASNDIQRFFLKIGSADSNQSLIDS